MSLGASAAGQVPLAIVGIGCLFPKAGNAGAFWLNIKNGVDGIGPVPPTHWNPEDYFDPDPKAPDRTYAARGGFIEPVDFHPLDFGIAPNDLEATDTAQLLGLVAARQALADAYNTNPQLLAQRALLRATDEQVPQALANWRPTVNFTGQVGGTRSGFVTPSTGLPPRGGLATYSTFYSNSLNLTATQQSYSGGRTAAQTSQAINTVESTRAQTLAVETTVFQAVAMAYLDVVRDQALLQVNQNNVAVLRKQLEATQDRFRVGEVTRTDVAQAEASLAQAVGQLVTAQGNLEISREEYVRAVGHPPGTSGCGLPR